MYVINKYFISDEDYVELSSESHFYTNTNGDRWDGEDDDNVKVRYTYSQSALVVKALKI